MLENTQFPAPAQPPLFAWPSPGPAAHQVTWSEFLTLAARACEQTYPGSPGRFLGAYIHALASQAVALQAESPEVHESRAEAERLREAARIHTLEHQADCWPLAASDLSDDATGGTGGHPADETGPVQVWLGDPCRDDTYMN